MKPLINKHTARAMFMAAAKEWGRPLSRPPVGYYKELERVLLIKIHSEAAHAGNCK